MHGDSFDHDLKLREADLAPCHFFYGEETFIAREFIRKARVVLLSGEAGEFGFERFYFPESGWRDVVDSARTAASLFSPWRMLVVMLEAKKPKKENEDEGGEDAPAAKRAKTGTDVLREYLSDPAPKTVLIVALGGPVKKTHPLVRFFSSIPAVVVKEMRPLKENKAAEWLDARAARMGKRLDPAAKERLLEISGCDLGILDGELEKLALYTAGRPVITEDDIDQLSGWVKTFENYEIENALVAADVRQSLIVLDRLFLEGHRPEEIMGQLARVFRDLLMAKLLLREGMRRREVFAEIKPQILPSYRPLYEETFGRLFDLLDRLSFSDLDRFLTALKRIDAGIKTTDSTAQTLIERFFVEFCAAAGREGIISPGRRPGARPAG